MADTMRQPSSSTPLLHDDKGSTSKQRPPTFKPLTEKFKKRALRYIEDCETTGYNNGHFVDFCHQVKWRLDDVPENGDRVKLGKSFVELVIFEVQLNNFMAGTSYWDLGRRISHRLLLIEYRWRSRHLWGRTTKYHAKIHRDFINNELAKRSITRSFPGEEEDDSTDETVVMGHNLSSRSLQE